MGDDKKKGMGFFKKFFLAVIALAVLTVAGSYGLYKVTGKSSYWIGQQFVHLP